MAKNKKHIYFLRWGNLNPIKHKEARGAKEDEWIHVAPCYKGIYAFPCGYVEPFLLSGGYGKKFIHPLIKDGQKIKENNFYDDNYNIKSEYIKLLKKLNIRTNHITGFYSKEDNTRYVAYRESPKHFEYNGDIWHHLGDYIDKNDIIDSKHGWYKTSFKTYLKALNKCDTIERFQSYMQTEKGKRHGNPHTMPNMFTKDFYEVFIEHLK